MPITKALPKPKNNLAKILYDLIQGKFISEQSYFMNGFRMRLSQLRNEYDIPIRKVKQESVNEFGRPISYYRHFLLTISRGKACKVYLKINSK